jgi:NIMA (never in mitosis gene a)-related kinase
VLYELCTLKHAFSADNLLGLVYKIVQDKYDPIPACYSKELQNLISALLNKNAQERPSVSQILQMPIVRQKMIEFVNSGGMTIGAPNRIYIKNAPVVKPVQDFPQ